jgi:rubredoxin-NAD+ reductase
MDPIVIIGSGLAGYNVARELRKRDKLVPLTILSADSAHVYSKPMLSSSISKAPEAIAMNTAEQMSAQLGATVRANIHVTAIEPERHALHLYHETVSYSKLVLALGADQIKLALEGNAA